MYQRRFLSDLTPITSLDGTRRFLVDFAHYDGQVVPMDARAVPQADGMPSVVGIPPHTRCDSAYCEECWFCECSETTGEGCPVHDPYAATRAIEQRPEMHSCDPRWHAFLGVSDDA